MSVVLVVAGDVDLPRATEGQAGASKGAGRVPLPPAGQQLAAHCPKAQDRASKEKHRKSQVGKDVIFLSFLSPSRQPVIGDCLLSTYRMLLMV